MRRLRSFLIAALACAGSAQLAAAAPAPEAQAEPAPQTVTVTSTRDPVDKSYRKMIRGMERFEREIGRAHV